MQIRSVDRADRAIYLELTKEFYESPAVLHAIPAEFRERTFEALFSPESGAESFLFESGGEVMGYALLARYFSQEAGGMAYQIEELYVRPEHRSKGIGRLFFEFLETKSAHVARLRLEVESENERAIAMYQRQGFEYLPYVQMVKDRHR